MPGQPECITRSGSADLDNCFGGNSGHKVLVVVARQTGFAKSALRTRRTHTPAFKARVPQGVSTSLG